MKQDRKSGSCEANQVYSSYKHLGFGFSALEVICSWHNITKPYRRVGYEAEIGRVDKVPVFPDRKQSCSKHRESLKSKRSNAIEIRQIVID